MTLKYYGFICLFLMLLMIIVYPLAKFKYRGNCHCSEGFHNKKTGLTYSNNIPENTYLLKDYYPTDNRLIIDANNYSHNWLYYPIFSLGSYEQITNNIKFISEKKFESCKRVKELPFDFYLPEFNTCIEYDGELHYKSSLIFGGEETLKRIKINDRIKTKWCRQNSINLIRISYKNKNKIFEVLDKNFKNLNWNYTF